jgi:hypothetical protein
LSHTASTRRFKQDAQKCAGQYPPGEAVLYFHPFPNDDVSQARTLDGKRYGDQEYAFAFRKKFLPQCAGRLHDGLAALKERVYTAVPDLLAEPAIGLADSVRPVLSVPIPIARQLRSSDPETRANRRGKFIPRKVAPPSEDDIMRTVGDPHYFPELVIGPPATVAGYEPPDLVDYRLPEKSSALRAIR